MRYRKTEKWHKHQWQTKPEKTVITRCAILLDQRYDDGKIQHNAHYICRYHLNPSCVRSFNLKNLRPNRSALAMAAGLAPAPATITADQAKYNAPNDGLSHAGPRTQANPRPPGKPAPLPGVGCSDLVRQSNFHHSKISDLPLSHSAVETGQAPASCPNPLCVSAPLRLCVGRRTQPTMLWG